MATKIVKITYQLKRGPQSVIETQNPILAEGEPIVVFCEDGSTRLKIGDGKTPYKDLAYIGCTVTQDDSGEIVKIEIDSELSEYSINPVENRVVTRALDNKVDKIDGKVLSDNNYSTEDMTKLAQIEDGANKTIVDTELNTESSNPIQNAVVAQMFNNLEDKLNNLTLDGGEIL